MNSSSHHSNASAIHKVALLFLSLGVLWCNTAPAQSFGFDNQILYFASSTSLDYVGLTNSNSTDTQADNADEIWSEVINFFPFIFYGQTFSQIQFSSNGYVTFGSGQSGNPPNGGFLIPGSGYPDNTIAVIGTDLDPSVEGDVNYRIVGAAPNRVLEVGFHNCRYWSNIVGANVQGLLRLFETSNIIEIHLGVSAGNSLFGQDKSTGLNRNASVGQQFWRTTGTGGPPNNTAVRYDPNPVVTSFVRIDSSPTFSPGGGVRFEVVFDRPVSNVQASDFSLNAPGLPGATITNVSGASTTYEITCSVGSGGSGTLSVTLDDPDKSIHVQNTGRVQSPVTSEAYVINELPRIESNVASLNFGTVTALQSIDLSFILSNEGDQTLNVSNITSSSGVYAVTNGVTFTIGAGLSRTIDVRFTPSAVQSYNGNALTIFNNSYNNGSLNIVLNGAGIPPLPDAPQNFAPGARSANAITWTWQDGGPWESGYKIYAGLLSPPVTPNTITAQNATQWTHTPLSANTQYFARAAGTNSTGDSPFTSTVSAFTLAEPVADLVYTDISATTITFEAAVSPSNIATGQSGLIYGNQSLGINSLWFQSNPGFTSGGLTPNTLYQLFANTRNAEAIESLPFSDFRHTLAGPPVLGVNVATSSGIGDLFSAADTISFSNPAGFGTSSHNGSDARVSAFRYRWFTNPTHTFTGVEPVWNNGALVLAPVASGAHYLHLLSLNGDNAPSSTLAIGPFNFDLVAPTGSIIIGSAIAPGPDFVNTTSVTLYLDATDTGGSGVEKMRFSNDGITWTPPTWSSAPAFASTFPAWDLTLGEGLKTVFAQFRDVAGNVSTATISDTTTLDQTPPSAPSVSSSTPTNDTTPAWSWVSGGSADSASLYRYQVDSEIGTWTETGQLSYTYNGPALLDGAFVTLFVQEQDEAGNWSSSDSFTVEIKLTGENPPSVSGVTPTNDATPDWSWSSGGGVGIYRYGFAEGLWLATNVADTSFTPLTPLAEGPHTLFVQEQDLATNWSNSGSFTITVDLSGPSPTFFGNTTPTKNPRVVTLLFGESVFGFDPGDLIVTNANILNVSPAGPATAYTIVVEGISNGPVTVALPANQVTDQVGNGNTASPVFTYLHDLNGPSLVSFAPADGLLLGASSLNIELLFDEPVSISTGAVLNLSGDAALGASTGAPENVAGDLWRIPVTGLQSGALFVALEVTGSEITDLPGNDYLGGVVNWSYTVDVDPPIIEVLGPDPAITNGEDVIYVVTYLGADAITLSDEDIVLVFAGSADAVASVSMGALPNERIITLSAIEGNGTIQLNIQAGTAFDLAGNVAPEYIGGTDLVVQAAALHLPWLGLFLALLAAAVVAMRSRQRHGDAT